MGNSFFLVSWNTEPVNDHLEHYEPLFSLCSSSAGWINPPLRFKDEPCRHKVLDLIGDLSLLSENGNQGLPVAHLLAYKVFISDLVSLSFFFFSLFKFILLRRFSSSSECYVLQWPWNCSLGREARDPWSVIRDHDHPSLTLGSSGIQFWLGCHERSAMVARFPVYSAPEVKQICLIRFWCRPATACTPDSHPIWRIFWSGTSGRRIRAHAAAPGLEWHPSRPDFSAGGGRKSTSRSGRGGRSAGFRGRKGPSLPVGSLWRLSPAARARSGGVPCGCLLEPV